MADMCLYRRTKRPHRFFCATPAKARRWLPAGVPHCLSVAADARWQTKKATRLRYAMAGMSLQLGCDKPDWKAHPPGEVYMREPAQAPETRASLDPTHSLDSNGGVAWNAESILLSVSSSEICRFWLLPRAIPPLRQRIGELSNSGYRQVFHSRYMFGAANCTPKTTCISHPAGDGREAKESPPAPR